MNGPIPIDPNPGILIGDFKEFLGGQEVLNRQLDFYNTMLGVPWTPEPTKTPKAKFVLVRRYCDINKWWYEDAGDFWINPRFGSTHRKHPEDVSFESAEADDHLTLDYTKTELILDHAESWWLSPEGRFYGCDYANHDAVAEMILRQRVSHLESGLDSSGL